MRQLEFLHLRLEAELVRFQGPQCRLQATVLVAEGSVGGLQGLDPGRQTVPFGPQGVDRRGRSVPRALQGFDIAQPSRSAAGFDGGAGVPFV